MQHSCLRFKAVLLVYVLSLMGWVVPEGCQEVEIDQHGLFAVALVDASWDAADLPSFMG